MIDSTQIYFFEGAEKLLELWFEDPGGDRPTLRSIPRQELIDMLNLAECHIINSIHNEHVDAYLLSESSMFVSDFRFNLKTCGTTKLLDTVERMLHLAEKYCNMVQIRNVYYSRKNFVRPELQSPLHRTFDKEAAYLDTFFKDGAAYCLGQLMKQDCWYLYTLNPPRGEYQLPDQTLEILMTGLSQEITWQFTSDGGNERDGMEVTKTSGIKALLPDKMIIDAKLFEPCGYSMNGLMPNSDQYVTIHITPEVGFSYVSFETNINQANLFELTCKVLECFRPDRFLMTLFANDISVDVQKVQKQLWDQQIPGYRRFDLQTLRLPHDILVYAQFKQACSVQTKS